MRLRAILFAVVVLAGVGAGAWRLAGAAAAWVERTTGERVHAALDAAGQGWAGVELDGLKVTLTGAAPDETSRFRALEIVRQIVDARRISDTTTIRAAERLPAPPFALELLRNEADVSLIGLVPETGGRDVIRSALGAGGLDEHVTDMLETAAEPAPEGWREALGFGLAVLAELPRAKISVSPGRLTLIAVADSDPDRAALEDRLRQAAPDGVTLALDISAPRPVIAPFAFDFSLAGGAARLAACSAESPEAAAGIVAAARAAGLAGDADCAVGLGAPSRDWVTAVARGLDAVRALGGGRFTLRDLEAELTGPDGVAPDRLTEVSARLDAALPAAYRLATVMPSRAAAQPDGGRADAPRFAAVLALDGSVRLSGPVQDTTSRAAIESYAASLFGHDNVADATVIDPELPEGWPGRVLAGVGALAGLKQGKVEVTPEQVAVEGWGIDPDVDEKVAALLADKVGGAEAVVKVTFNAEAAAAAADAARPKPEICADQIAAILQAGSINFAAGSADIVPESRGVIAAIADVLRGCPGAAFEIGGHTDSQGADAANQRLSEERAQAVLAALEAADLPLMRLTARGYGADEPVGDNATAAGRAGNRRIAFTLITPEQAAAAEAAAAAAEEAEAEGPAAAEACAEGIAAILVKGSIQFTPGSAEIAPESGPVIAEIAGALGDCPDAAFEIGGHTDSEGSESGNQRLSQQRAEAVLAALRADLPLPGFTARGYGEAEPVADNATSEGRARNRRIAFTLVATEPAAEGDTDETAVPDTLCAERIAGILGERSIQFAAGSATIAPESEPVIAAIQGVLRTCPEAALEIGGHTDSQGSESGNRRLSEDRAQAVLAALRADDLPLPGVSAHGYGESDPIADNATADGRAQNRRIAFTAAAATEDAGTGAAGEPE
jgi:OmpA-OmpF porin, OOP family